MVHEGGIAVLAKGCSLEIVSVPSNERLAAATFATDAQVMIAFANLAQIIFSFRRMARWR